MTERESKSSSCLKILGMGCLVMIVLIVLTVGIGGYYLKTQWRHWTARVITAVTDDMLSEFRLSESDREGVKAEIARFVTHLESGQISIDQIRKLVEEVRQGPLPGLLFLHGVAIGHLVPPDVPKEEIEQAQLDAQRLQRAAVEGKVSSQALQEIFKAIPREAKEPLPAEREPPGSDPSESNREQTGDFKKEITARDWRPVMSLIKKMADEAGIPNEPYHLNLTQEIRKLLDQVLSSSS